MPFIADSYGNYNSDILKQSMGELLGLARGVMADQELSDNEIEYLNDWLGNNSSIRSSFPGNVIHERIREVLADGVVTEEERTHLVDTLNMLIEGRLDGLKDQIDLSEFWFDEVGSIDFHNTRFCLTGNFVYGPVALCKTAIEEHGGVVSANVGNELQFLVVGGLGVDEWRIGGLGVEIEAAIKLRNKGIALKIIPEDKWVSQL